MASNESDELLTVDEVAEYLRLNSATVYRKIESGELDAVRLGKGTRAPMRIRRSVFEQWLAGGESSEAPVAAAAPVDVGWATTPEPREAE